MIQELASYLIVGVIAIWFICFFIMSYYRYIEERLYSEWEREKNLINNKTTPIPMCFIEQQQKRLETKYKNKIEQLERKKQFIRDVLPFIKK